MRPSERAAQARRELDRKFNAADLGSIRARPHSGWIRAIREALGMSQTALARLLEISPAAVSNLERAEPHGGITIGKLAEVAAALNCTLVYALVPDFTLEQIVLDQAGVAAAGIFGYTARTMELEDQAVSDERQREAIERYAEELVRRGDVWDTP